MIPVPNDLVKLSKQVQEDFVKKTDFNDLKTKVNGVDTTKFVLKTKYDSEGADLKLKINDVSGLLQTSVFNSKITEIGNKITGAENKIPDIINLVTKAELPTVENKIPGIKNLVNKAQLTAVENKIPDVNGFVKKTDYATKITKIKNDYVTTTALNARHKDLVQKATFDSELEKVSDKADKNSSDILSFESRVKQKKTY